MSVLREKFYKTISFLKKFKSAIIIDVLFIINSMRKRPMEVLGVDIGRGSIKVAQVRYIEEEPFLLKTKIVEFRPEIEGKEEENEKEVEVKEVDVKEVVELEKKDRKRKLWEKAVVEALKGAFLDFKISPWTKVVTVVSGPRVTVRQVIVPHKATLQLNRKIEHLSIREMKELIRWEIKDYLPFSVEEAVIEFDTREKIIVEEEGIKRLRVFISVTINEVVASHLGLIRAAGLSPALITNIPCSLANLIKRYKLLKEDEMVAIIDIGKEKTDITIFKGENVEFDRSVLVAGDDIDLFLTVSLVVEGKPLKLDLAQAESVKKKWGIPLSEDRTLKIEEGFSIAELLSMIRPAAERLTIEIKRSFDFYERNLKGRKIEKIILLGGTSGLKGLKELLSQELGIEVEIGDFLKDIPFLSESNGKEEKVNISLVFTIALGAALSDLKGINLLPLDIRKEPIRRLRKRLLMATAASIVLFLLLGYKFLQLKLDWAQKGINTLEAELASFRPQMGRIGEIIELQNQIAKKSAIIERILSSQPYWQEVLKEISNIIPSNIYLTEVRVDKRVFLIKGVLISEEEAKRAPLSDFIVGLENSIFKKVEILDMKKDILNRVFFEITCGLD